MRNYAVLPRGKQRIRAETPDASKSEPYRGLTKVCIVCILTLSIRKEVDKMKSEQARAAQLIRGELKAAFPGVKFSVTSQSFSGGNSIGVSWEGNPEIANVNKIIKKYQYGSFNGMTDSYDYDNNRADLTQVRFVQASRNY